MCTCPAMLYVIKSTTSVQFDRKNHICKNQPAISIGFPFLLGDFGSTFLTCGNLYIPGKRLTRHWRVPDPESEQSCVAAAGPRKHTHGILIGIKCICIYIYMCVCIYIIIYVCKIYMQTAFTIFNAKRDQQEVYCMCKICFVQVCKFVYIYIFICHPVFEHCMENGPFIDDKHDDEALNRMMFPVGKPQVITRGLYVMTGLPTFSFTSPKVGPHHAPNLVLKASNIPRSSRALLGGSAAKCGNVGSFYHRANQHKYE